LLRSTVSANGRDAGRTWRTIRWLRNEVSARRRCAVKLESGVCSGYRNTAADVPQGHSPRL
jgi:hypothetical protein